MIHSALTERAVGLFDRLLGAPSREDLQAAAQLAIQVEFSTIPVYLFGLYSISDPDSEAYQALRSVVIEEMFHLNQAANLLVGIGGKPVFTDVPTYPGYLPQANPKTTPWIGLHRASPSTFDEIYAAIETPAPVSAPPQGTNYDSIGQLYGSLEQGLHAYIGDDLFEQAAGMRQRVDIYLGKFGGQPIEVVDLDSADAGINEILKQGEGTVDVGEPLIPFQPNGVYNHYGRRTDGTYGPIIGTPYELSHFSKFRKVALEPQKFPSTYPVLSNPSMASYPQGSEAYTNAMAFNVAYSNMLRALEDSFTDTSPDPYFLEAFPLMHDVLPKLAQALMSTPINANGDPDIGPNAAPTFEYVPEMNDLTSLEGSIAVAMEQVKNAGKQIKQMDAKLKPLTEALEAVKRLHR